MHLCACAGVCMCGRVDVRERVCVRVRVRVHVGVCVRCMHMYMCACDVCTYARSCAHVHILHTFYKSIIMYIIMMVKILSC